MDLYEEFIQHKDQLESEKQEEKQQDAHGQWRQSVSGRPHLGNCD